MIPRAPSRLRVAHAFGVLVEAFCLNELRADATAAANVNFQKNSSARNEPTGSAAATTPQICITARTEHDYDYEQEQECSLGHRAS